MIKTHTGEIIKPTIFPDGTSQVWKIGEDNFRQPFAVITWTFENEAELIHVAQLKLLFEVHQKPVHLHIPYLPYARQDKKISNETTFALYAFVRIINSLYFESVMVFDPHPDLYNLGFPFERLSISRPDIEISHAIKSCTPDMVCFPDEGAKRRYAGFIHLPYAIGEKERNPLTGKIMRYELTGNVRDRKILIIDDICDGGATFILLAKALMLKGAREWNLYCSHGLFTKGTQILRDARIQRIFTREGEYTK